MRELLRRIVLAGVLLVAVMVVSASLPARAIDLFKNCTDPSCSVVKDDKLKSDGNTAVWKIVQQALAILGLVAVVMIVVGGIKYAASGGDSAGIKSAKDTIMYAIIGLVVAISGYVIILLVTNFFG
ncbi:MAG: hypothetical protein WAQ25_00490 [Candidatus Saccharimonas sp.]